MKIVQVINAMIANKNKISNVITGTTTPNTEYFFLYNGKHKWSIINDNSGDYYLHFYPAEDKTIQQLASHMGGEWQSFTPFVTYSSAETKTQESLESFHELYQIVSNKVHGIDDIFDEIIKGQ